MAKKLGAAMALAITLAALGGCNTVRGLGQDIESVADAGDRAL